MAPMTMPLFSTYPAAPVEVAADEVGPVCVLVTVLVAVRMGPVAVTTVIPVEVAADSEPETDAEADIEADLD